MAITLTDLKSEHESLVAERVGWDDRVRLMLREATERDILDDVLGRCSVGFIATMSSS